MNYLSKAFKSAKHKATALRNGCFYAYYHYSSHHSCHSCIKVKNYSYNDDKGGERSLVTFLWQE